VAVKRSPTAAAALTVLIALASGCGHQPAELAPSLVGPATASPLVFHGNCFAGWIVDVDLLLRETSGLAVLVDRIAYRLTDVGQARVLASETLDAGALEDRYKTHMVAANGSSVFSLTGRSGVRPVGPLVLDGEVTGRDEKGRFVSLRFQLTAASLIVTDPVLGPGGACQAGTANSGRQG